jgi:hypothetical protein
METQETNGHNKLPAWFKATLDGWLVQQRETEAEPRAAEFCSPTITKLAVALAKAQGGFGPIERTREVTVRPRESAAYTFRYAPLDVVLAATLPSLNANGLSLVSLPIRGGACLRTLLLHESGEFLAVEVEMPETEGPQKFGSALTYLRRYSAISLLGVASEEDDDGNAAEGNHVEKKTDRAPAPRTPAARHDPQSPPNPRPWMPRLVAAINALKLGEDAADRAGLKGKERDERIKGAKLLYIAWCAGRDTIKSTLDLTDAEAAEVIRRAEAGETP